MKAVFVCLCIAAVAQMIFAASVERSKRATDKSFGAMKEIMAEKKTMVVAVLKDMPKTEAYQEFRNYWEEFVGSYDEKDDDIPCFIKLFYLSKAFDNAITQYDLPNAPVEAKEVFNLFKQHGFLDHVKSNYEKFSAAGGYEKTSGDVPDDTC